METDELRIQRLASSSDSSLIQCVNLGKVHSDIRANVKLEKMHECEVIFFILVPAQFVQLVSNVELGHQKLKVPSLCFRLPAWKACPF